MSQAIQNILQSFSLSNEQVTVLYPYLREVFINETPLTTRLRREQAQGPEYNIVVYDVRPRSYTLNAAITTSATTMTLVDASMLQVGDVLEMYDTAADATERIEVTASSTDGVTVTVRRAREGTTAQANDTTGSATSKVVTLIGNSRTGAEVDQLAFRSVRNHVPQQVQTYQYAVQVGGLANAVQNVRLPSGIADVFTMEQKTQMTNMMRDVEYTTYYGIGETASAVGDRRKATGLRSLIGYYNGGGVPTKGSNVNIKTNAGSSYTFLNFVADGPQKVIDGGGDPSVVVCSTDFFTGLQTWGFAKQQINTPRMNLLGLPIEEIAIPFATKVLTFVPSYQLRKGTAIVLTEADVLMRQVRAEHWQPRGIRGDAREGDFLADLCPEIGHPGWHAWVEGITSFA